MTKIAIYCRVSKSDGSQSIERQLLELRTFAKQQNWTIVEEVTENVSGRKIRREGTNRLIALAKGNLIQKVLIHEVTRLGRNQADTHNTVEELFQNKCSLYDYNQRMETLNQHNQKTAFGSMVLPMLAAMAEDWVNRHSYRIKSGLKLAVAKGIKLGRPKQQKYKCQDEILSLLEKGFIVIDEKLNKTIRASNRNIAKYLGINVNTVKRVRAKIDEI